LGEGLMKLKYNFKVLLLGREEKFEMFMPLADRKMLGKEIRGVQFLIKAFETEDSKVSLALWDFTTDPRFENSVNLYFQGGESAIIVEDDDKKIDTWKERIRKHASKNTDIIVLSPHDSVEGVLESIARKLLTKTQSRRKS